MIYITSDTHFSHKNIIEYCDRPYTNPEEMNKNLISKWNSVVKEDDIVLHLGDVGFGLVEELSPIIQGLNGHKILIRGNHDFKRGVSSWTNIGFEKVYKEKNIDFTMFLEDVREILGIKQNFYSTKNDLKIDESPRNINEIKGLNERVLEDNFRYKIRVLSENLTT